MSLDQVIGPLVSVTLIELMLVTGLGAQLADVIKAAHDRRLVLRASLANYVAVPAAAMFLLLLVDADPLAATGILILAVCPGAPYAPPLTTLAGGKSAMSVGLMMIMAGSSVLMAPLLLFLLTPPDHGRRGYPGGPARDDWSHPCHPVPALVLRARRESLAAGSGG